MLSGNISLQQIHSLIINLHIEVLIPVGVERLLDYAGSVRLLSVDSYNSKGIWKPENIALDETVRRDDCGLTMVSTENEVSKIVSHQIRGFSLFLVSE